MSSNWARGVYFLMAMVFELDVRSPGRLKGRDEKAFQLTYSQASLEQIYIDVSPGGLPFTSLIYSSALAFIRGVRSANASNSSRLSARAPSGSSGRTPTNTI